jgi:hypothetical protein
MALDAMQMSHRSVSSVKKKQVVLVCMFIQLIRNGTGADNRQMVHYGYFYAPIISVENSGQLLLPCFLWRSNKSGAL